MRKGYLLITCLVMGLCVLSGCSATDDFVAGTYEVDAAEVSNIVVDVTDRSITVSPSADGQVHIDYFHSPKEFYNISLEDGTLTMEYAEDKSWTDFISVKPADSVRRIDIRVPESAISSLTADTKNEGISVSDLTLDSIDLYSNGGNVSVSDIDADGIRLEVKNGNISGSVAGTVSEYSISIDIKKGDTNISENQGGPRTMDLKANNGDINIRFNG